MLVIIFALVAVGGWVLLNRTTFGRRTFAVGGNPEAARLAGINVKRHTMLLYVLFGVCCGIAAVMLIARTTTGSSTHGNALRARRHRGGRHRRHAALGGRGTIVGTVFGVLIFTTLTNVFTLNNLSISAQAVAKGVIIVARRPAPAAAGLPKTAPGRTASRATAPHRPGSSTGSARSGQAPPDLTPRAPSEPHRSRTARQSARRHLAAGRGRRHRAGAVLHRRSRPGDERSTRRRPRSPLRGAPPLPAAAAATTPRGGDTVVDRLLRPGGRPRLDGGITDVRAKAAAKYDDVDLQVAEGTNDVSPQISQVETFINDKVDAIVLLPFDGAALTPVALKAMDAGIPVINVDREFDDPNAARVTVLGDNYGMGVSAGAYICSS